MASFRFVYISTITCLFLITATDCEEYRRCHQDYDCLPGYFCYLTSGLCSACVNCTSYNRNAGDKPCAKDPQHCGPCLKGFEVVLFTNNDVQNLCIPTLSPSRKSSLHIDLWIWLSALVLILFLLFMAYKLYKKAIMYVKASNHSFSSLFPKISGYNSSNQNQNPVSQSIDDLEESCDSGYAPSAPNNPVDDSGDTPATPLVKSWQSLEDASEPLINRPDVDTVAIQLSAPFRSPNYDNESGNHPTRPFLNQNSMNRDIAPVAALLSSTPPTQHSSQSEIGPEYRQPSLGSDRTQENNSDPLKLSILINAALSVHSSVIQSCGSSQRHQSAPGTSSSGNTETDLL